MIVALGIVVIIVLAAMVDFYLLQKKLERFNLSKKYYTRKHTSDEEIIRGEFAKMRPVCPYCDYRYHNICIHDMPKTCPKCGASSSKAITKMP